MAVTGFFSPRALLSLYLLLHAVHHVSSLQSSRLSFRTQLDVRKTTTNAHCANSGDIPCYQGLPADICCDSEQTCLVIAANTTAVCVPAHFKTSEAFDLKPIACDIGLQDWREHPDAPFKTIALHRKLPRCGEDSCCPHGYTCRVDDMDDVACVLDNSVDAARKYQDLRPSSIPLVTEYPTASPTVLNVDPETSSESNFDSAPTPSPTASGAASGILTLAVPSSSGDPEAADAGVGPQTGDSDDSSSSQSNSADKLSIGLIVGISVAAAVTVGLAVFVWLRRKQLFPPRQQTALWANDDFPPPHGDDRCGTPMAELDSKESVAELAVKAYNTTELPADSTLNELSSPTRVAKKPSNLPVDVAELPGSPASPISPTSPSSNKRASIVPLSSWNTRNTGQFERAKSLWYQKRGA